MSNVKGREVPSVTLRIPAEVASYAGCSQRTIRAAARDGSLPTVRLGKWRVARIVSIDKWLAGLETRGIPKAVSESHARRGDLAKATAARGKRK